LRVPAYAKINLTLEVLGRREDGYHEVRTILETVDLADQLDVEDAPGLRVECDLPGLNGSANLVWRSAQELANSRGIEPRAHILIRKRIPMSMGLGGGSSDAASALVALNQLWGLHLSVDELSQIAARLGSDVPFFLQGGTALAEGRGDQVSFLPPLLKLPMLLICPAESLGDKTRTLYSRITPAHYSDGGVTRRMLETLMAGQFVVDCVYNVFEQVAFQTFPELGVIYNRVREATGIRPHLSGSGPGMFCVPGGEEERERLNKALQPYGTKAYLINAIMPEFLID
jgi:4-diphosphocytidyl-2-C-methyl-D-erythritol kinase